MTRRPAPRAEAGIGAGKSYEVIVVGAGPVGLTLALGLARDGADVLVLEKEPRTAEHSRAPAIWCAAQEVLRELDVLDRLIGEGVPMPEIAMQDADRGGVLVRIPVYELEDETGEPRLLVVPQSTTERILCEAAREAGVEIRFGAEVVGCRETDDGVEAVFRADGEERITAARFLAGCDGAGSTVRKEIGGTLAGETYDMRAALADFEMAEDRGLPSPRLTTCAGMAVAIRMGPRLWRLIIPFSGELDGGALDRRIEAAVQQLLPGAGKKCIWKSEFRLHRRMSSIWSRGRIALAGDAAHLNSPVGGQGMNAGILDAAALRNAVAEALERDDPALLAAYAARRRETVQGGVNRFTDALTKLLLAGRGRLVRPALAGARLLLAVPPVRRRILRRFAMLDQR